MKKQHKAIALGLLAVLLYASPVSGQEPEKHVPPDLIMEMRNKLEAAEKKLALERAEPRYKDLVDLWAAGRLTTGEVMKTKGYMPPVWYENLMKLALCPSPCRQLTAEEMAGLNYPSYLLGPKRIDESDAPD